MNALRALRVFTSESNQMKKKKSTKLNWILWKTFAMVACAPSMPTNELTERTKWIFQYNYHLNLLLFITIDYIPRPENQ